MSKKYMNIFDTCPNFMYHKSLMRRYLEKPVLQDLKSKMVFISGPRQVGKTTVCRHVAPQKHRYMNWDVLTDREFILREKFPCEKFIIYDEIHKFHNWRNYIKGFYDKSRKKKKILVTGSARLDYYRHSGDSLIGRYHHYRLHPLTVRELNIKTQKGIQDLLTLGGFPEPFLSGSKTKSLRWIRENRSRVVYEDISVLEFSKNLSQMEALILRLPDLTGSPLSINSLREDLNTAHKTVSKWLNIFERMHLIFTIPPYTSNRLRSLKKEQKHYHYNWAEVSDLSARFENLVAGHLLKWVHFQQDHKGENIELNYFRDTDKREVDFIVVKNKKPMWAVEVKIQSKQISSSLKFFKKKFPKTKCIQVHLKGSEEYSQNGIQCLGWFSFLNQLI